MQQVKRVGLKLRNLNLIFEDYRIFEIKELSWSLMILILEKRTVSCQNIKEAMSGRKIKHVVILFFFFLTSWKAWESDLSNSSLTCFLLSKFHKILFLSRIKNKYKVLFLSIVAFVSYLVSLSLHRKFIFLIV